MDELTSLRNALEEERRRSEQLAQENTDLKQKVRAVIGELPSDGKHITYLEFRALVMAKIGKSVGDEQGWRAAFLFGNNGKYNDGHMTRWRKNGLVPVDAVAAIDTIDLSRCPTGQIWTVEEKNTFIAEYLVVEGGKVKLARDLKISDVAAELTKRFGRPINENSVKSKMNSYRLSLASPPKVVTPDFTSKTDTAEAPVAEAAA